jgi:predicted ArsR family transcriptional regulator
MELRSEPRGRNANAMLAILADGESWSNSALAIALGASTRNVQRALDSLCGSRQGAVVRSRASAAMTGRAVCYSSTPAV